MQQIKRVTRDLKRDRSGKYDIGQYVRNLSKIKTIEKENRRQLGQSRNFLSRTKHPPRGPGQFKTGQTNYLKQHFKGPRPGQSQSLLASSGRGGQAERDTIRDRVLGKEALEGIEAKQRAQNRSMVLYREIDEWHRKLRSSIPVKKNCNTGYPRIKLHVFLDQIKQ